MATNSMGSVCNTPKSLSRLTRASRVSAVQLLNASYVEEDDLVEVTLATGDNQNTFKAFMYGLINAALVVPVCMSFTAIIFSNPFFTPFMPTLVKLVGLSSAVHQIMFTSLSSLPFAIGQVQDAGLIFLSAMASSVVSILANDPTLSPEAIVATTLVTLSSATALMGVALIMTGKFKLASLVQYLPMPVIGGYLSYIGFFCMEAGLGLMANKEVKNIMDWPQLFNYESMLHIVPGLLCGAALFILSSKLQHFLVMPLTLTAVLLGFYTFLFVGGLSFDDVRAGGWVSYPPAVTATPLQVFELFDFSLVQWRAIPPQFFTWLGMYFVVAFSSSLDVAAIEMNMGTDLDYNHELKTVGWSNTVSGLFGGFTGSYIFSQTIFTLKSNTNSRIPGIVVLAAELLIFVLPIPLTAYIPKFFFGGLLTLIAIDLMMEWLVHASSKLRFREYLLVLATFVLINLLGLEQGMIAGLICAMTNFVFSYAEGVSVVKTLSRSRVQRSYQERQFLRAHQSQIVTLELHGYFFFGSSIRLMEVIKKSIYVAQTRATEATPLLLLEAGTPSTARPPKVCSLKAFEERSGVKTTDDDTDDARHPTRFLLLDFHHVSGIDATASRSCFTAMKTLLARHNIALAFARLSPEIERQLQQNGVLDDDDATDIHLYATADAGLEVFENVLLNERPPATPISQSLSHNLFEKPHALPRVVSPTPSIHTVFQDALDVWDVAISLDKVSEYFTRRDVEGRSCVFAEGDAAESLFVVVSGELEIFRAGHVHDRIVKVSHGSLVGEVDFYLHQPRSYTCMAVANSVIYEINRDAMAAMVRNDPMLCTAIQTAFLKCMSLGAHNHLFVHHRLD
ncbi:Sulfate Permease (SulP) Family [Achlya hypogyna]|uniref:Sulfate Permease (SulP) Family n=1 Tax=Achlya hypogyna TaxID=1202772 RepID=A0A1V9ZAU5_ACHHY|nr:Sulfate Permease (SulP) Family [Achlya hypogyna]